LLTADVVYIVEGKADTGSSVTSRSINKQYENDIGTLKTEKRELDGYTHDVKLLFLEDQANGSVC
jgi:hypothetical protein